MHKAQLARPDKKSSTDEKVKEKSEKVIKEYCKFLGRGIRSLLSIYDSNKIILSGKMTDYWDRIYPYIEKEIFENFRK